MTNSILYGECVGPGMAATVRIHALAYEGCDLEADDAGAGRECGLPDGDVALWIGAIGPVQAIAERRGRLGAALRFKEPLDTRILAHFQST